MNISFRNQEHRTEIDARAGTFQAFELFGQHLLQSNHYASPEVQEKLETMNAARQDLEKYEQWTTVEVEPARQTFIFAFQGLDRAPYALGPVSGTAALLPRL